MADSVRPFRVSFPVINLPDNLGGKRALVIMTMSRPTDPNVGFSVCIDVDGQVYQNVPTSLSKLREASQAPVHFIEVRDAGIVAPVVGLVGPDGRAL